MRRAVLDRQCRPLAVLGMTENNRETGLELTPAFGTDGLVTAVVTDSGSGAVLMLAHMNAEALAATRTSGEAHFWSRSRSCLWKKGETSGHILRVVEMRIDCDQDAIWIIAQPSGPACHTNAASCFYRRIMPDGALQRI